MAEYVGRRLTVLLSALLCACYSRPNPVLVQRPVPDPAGISGTYCYVSAERNVRDARAMRSSTYWQRLEAQSPGVIARTQTSGFTGIPMRIVADSSSLDVMVVDSAVVVHFTDVSSRRRRRVRLPFSGSAGGELRIPLPNPSGGASFGIGSAKRWMTLTRGSDGTLVYIEWYQEKALAFFVLPMHETTARSVVFDRCATGDGEAR
jgi:hypothetical protein